MAAVWDWAGLRAPESEVGDSEPWATADIGVFEYEASELLTGYKAEPSAVERYGSACSISVPEDSKQVRMQFERDVEDLRSEVD